MDFVIYTVARVHVMIESCKKPLNDFRHINFDGTLSFARACAISGIKRFIFPSSIGVNGSETNFDEEFTEDKSPKPDNDYSLWKYEAEVGLQKISYKIGLDVMIMRTPSAYGVNAPGNFSSLLRLFRLGIPLPLSSIKNKRSFLSLQNLLDFLSLCTAHPKAANEVFLISDGCQLSTLDFFHALSSAANIQFRTFYTPTWSVILVLKILGLRKRFIGVCGNLRVNISKAKNYLGWPPFFSFNYCIKLAVDDLLKK
jgi:nucleoside-diphosphate-sugar epimerase